MKSLFFWLLIILSPQAIAHPSHDWSGQHRALELWANSIAPNTIAALHPDFGPGFNREDYVLVRTDFATFQTTSEGVVAAPVLFYVDIHQTLAAYSVLLQQVNGVWTVTRPVGGASLPPEIIDAKLPEQVSTKPMRFTLSDGQTGVPVFARVSIVDEAGTYWPPNGHQKNIRLGWRQDVGGDVFVDGRTFAYVEPVFSAQLPVGNYEILIMKGMEYSPTKVPFSVTDAPSETIEVSLNRWINMAEKSWFAGDTHTHFLSEKPA